MGNIITGLQIKFIILQNYNIFVKKSLNKSFLFLITACIISFTTNAQVARNYSNEFLNIGVGAAELGKANAVVASTDNVNAGYWNPAGLINVEDKQVALMHASYFANIANYDYIGFATKIDEKSAIGISLIRFGVDDILDTRALLDSGGNIATAINDLPTFSATDYAFTLSYARKPLAKNFTYGVNAKVIRRIIGDFATAWGFGIDAALQLKSKNEKWKYGVIVRDLSTTYNSWKIDDDIFDSPEGEQIEALENQEIPEKTEITIPSVQFGIHRMFHLKKDLNLGIEADANARFAETNDVFSSSVVSFAPAVGLELDYNKLIFLRGGVGNFQDVAEFDGSTSLSFQPNFGVGFSYKGITIDYALTDIGDQSEAIYSNIFSLIIDWSLFR